ncbi:MAG TPA: hypothetical protein GXZ90_05005 [Clostridiales bacterium]|nr:hypothetical protein [Clostridiales bacterium]
MKKLLIFFCCLIISTNIMGCNRMNAESEDNNNNNESSTDKNNSSEESEIDINNLFSNIQEIESVKTMRIDIQYTLKTFEQINGLMKQLENIEYSEYDTEKSKDEVAPRGESTGSITNGITLVFYYKNGSRKRLEFSSEEDGEFMEYVEVTYEPFKEKSRIYTTDEEVWADLLVTMEKGQKIDLNEK